jgi:hypothetical protein
MIESQLVSLFKVQECDRERIVPLLCLYTRNFLLASRVLSWSSESSSLSNRWMSVESPCVEAKTACGGDITIVISLLPKLSTTVSLLSHHAECSQRNCLELGCPWPPGVRLGGGCHRFA